MQEVTCPQCENHVEITPDASVCSVCGADLRALVDPEAAAAYFYQRASELASVGRKQQALTEVNRGLTYAETSDLRLLGAILSNQVADYGQMRTHVAAIPVDDALRDEGEWILRSHQAKQQGGRTSAKTGQGALPAPLQDADEAGTSSRGRQRASWPLILVFVILALLALLWFTGAPGTREGSEENASTTTSTLEPATPSADSEANADSTAAVAETEPGTPTETLDEDDNSAESIAATEPSPTPAPLATPTPEPTPEEDVSINGPVDVLAYLSERGYVGLALLDVEGELADGLLMLSGEVPMAEDLELLVEVAGGLEGADEVDATQISIEPPLTYTIGVGDSLWSISVRVYGDTEYMDDIYRGNREALGSPEYLPVGVAIELPRVVEK